MRRASSWVLLVLSLAMLSSTGLEAQGIQISGGLDGRLSNQDAENPGEVKDDFRPLLEGAFFNLRKVWSDAFGDRWIGVAQADFDDNFQRIRPYQVYLQYKGPLGKWNVRAGQYLLPFGLLTTYDTERLILQGIERSSLAVRRDTGVMAFGRMSAWDYAASVSDGLSDVRFADSRANPLVTARLAYVQGGSQFGISTLIGGVLRDPAYGQGSGRVQERRFALDATHSFGPLTLRAEGVRGADPGHVVGGGVALADYALTPRLEINTRYASWSGIESYQTVGAGVTFQIRQGLYFRVADQYYTRKENRKENPDGFTIQLYYEFSRTL